MRSHESDTTVAKPFQLELEGTTASTVQPELERRVPGELGGRSLAPEHAASARANAHGLEGSNVP